VADRSLTTRRFDLTVADRSLTTRRFDLTVADRSLITRPPWGGEKLPLKAFEAEFEDACFCCAKERRF
jgi:hypothetical protein